MVNTLASATLTEPLADNDGRLEAIMTYGRDQAARTLKQRIQGALGQDGLDLGVELTYVGLVSVHPPPQAAEAYEAVLTAERRQDQLRYEAEAWANDALARVAGDPSRALNLALSIRKLEELESL